MTLRWGSNIGGNTRTAVSIFSDMDGLNVLSEGLLGGIGGLLIPIGCSLHRSGALGLSQGALGTGSCKKIIV